MLNQYIAVHTSRSALVNDLKLLVQEYHGKTVSDEEMSEILSKWSKNCPKILYEDPDSNEPVLARTVAKQIGMKRTLIIQAHLNASH